MNIILLSFHRIIWDEQKWFFIICLCYGSSERQRKFNGYEADLVQWQLSQVNKNR